LKEKPGIRKRTLVIG